MARKATAAKPETKTKKRTLRKAKSILGKITKKVVKKRAVKKTVAKKAKPVVKRKKAETNGVYERIQQKAFEIFSQRGYAHGNDMFDWSVAEELVRLEAKKAKTGKKKAKLTQQGILQRTEQKAYELFERKGYAHGSDVNDWELARQLVELEIL